MWLCFMLACSTSGDAKDNPCCAGKLKFGKERIQRALLRDQAKVVRMRCERASERSNNVTTPTVAAEPSLLLLCLPRAPPNVLRDEHFDLFSFTLACACSQSLGHSWQQFCCCWKEGRICKYDVLREEEGLRTVQQACS